MRTWKAPNCSELIKNRGVPVNSFTELVWRRPLNFPLRTGIGFLVSDRCRQNREPDSSPQFRGSGFQLLPFPVRQLLKDSGLSCSRQILSQCAFGSLSIAFSPRRFEGLAGRKLGRNVLEHCVQAIGVRHRARNLGFLHLDSSGSSSNSAIYGVPKVQWKGNRRTAHQKPGGQAEVRGIRYPPLRVRKVRIPVPHRRKIPSTGESPVLRGVESAAIFPSKFQFCSILESEANRPVGIQLSVVPNN